VAPDTQAPAGLRTTGRRSATELTLDAAIAQQRLLASVRKNTDTGCWNWAGQVSNSGYGRTMLRDAEGSTRMESAHRASYELFIGPIPPDRQVGQSCGNRLCINPDHLVLIDPAASG